MRTSTALLPLAVAGAAAYLVYTFIAKKQTTLPAAKAKEPDPFRRELMWWEEGALD
jgi:hypothetical protein